jgi:(p)ppGpp synthase/HD superfamily hydrolase
MTLTKEHIDLALNIAKQYHSGQSDRAGKPYINHLLTVFKSVGGYNARILELPIVALLHDLIEDTNYPITEIYRIFGKPVGDAVKIITKTNEPHHVYLKRVKGNKITRIVKIADMVHNSNIARISNPSELDVNRVKQYKKDIEFLRK